MAEEQLRKSDASNARLQVRQRAVRERLQPQPERREGVVLKERLVVLRLALRKRGAGMG